MQKEVEPVLQFTLETGQVLAVNFNLDNATDYKFLVAVVAAQAEGRHRAEIANRTYHMGQKPTASKDYDDRLTVRLSCAPTTAYLYLSLPEHRGGIRHRRFGKKYHVTERDVRRFEGEVVGDVS